MHCIHCGASIETAARPCPSCGRPPAGPAADERPTPHPASGAARDASPPSEVDLLASRLQAALGGEYEVQGTLGQGGFAVVFRVLDRSLKRTLAVKVISPELVSTHSVVERFRREAETIAQLSHAHIVPVHFVGHKGDLFYLAMTFVEGESLADRLAREGRLPLEEAARIFREVASALDLAHRRGVVHRDVKPQNVLLEKDTGRALLTDFGIARTSESGHLTATGMVVGTPAYMSPEQVTGGKVDHRADIYALGILAWEMLTGRQPFAGPTPEAVLFRRVAEPAEPVERANPDVPADLAALVNRCVAADPDDRMHSAAEIVEALGGTTPRSGTRQTAARPVPRRARRGRVIAAAAGGSVVVVAVLLLLPGRGSDHAASRPRVPPGTVLVPAGTYAIGRDDGHEYSRPAHRVALDAFAIESTEVTVAAYREFVDSTGMVAPWRTTPDGQLPVTGATWSEAMAYCAWRHGGGRLPTEEEWEAAARGPTGFRYPWGDTWRQGAANTRSFGAGAPLAVASLRGGRTPLGVHDLVGNVWEWTSSRMSAYPGGAAPAGSGDHYVIRGGAFNTPDDVADATRRGYLPPVTADRGDLAATGFRCVVETAETRRHGGTGAR